MKPSFYGEALNTEVFERLENEEKEKEKKKLALASKLRKKEEKRKQTQVTRPMKRSTKKKSTLSSGRKRSAKNKKGEESTVEGSENSDNDTGVCEECGTYADDTREGKEKWMGCDNNFCPRWYHYDCLGLTSIPSGFWSCDV